MDLQKTKWYPELGCDEWIDCCEVLFQLPSSNGLKRFEGMNDIIVEVFDQVRTTFGEDIIKVVEHINYGNLGIFCIIVREKDLNEFYKDMISEP